MRRETSLQRNRRFNTEITFSGLCLVNFSQVCCGPNADKLAKRVDVRLLTTQGPCEHPHSPRLNYYVEDQISDKGLEKVVPSPDGRVVGSADLTNCDVEVVAPYPYDLTHRYSVLKLREPELDPGPKAPAFPVNPAEDEFLDWTLRSTNLGFGDLKPNAPCIRVKVPHGTWVTSSVIRNREVASMDPVLWQPSLDGKAAGRPTAIGANLRLRLQGLRFAPIVRIKPEYGDQREIQLIPGPDDLLRFSITNLPERGGGPFEQHLEMYGALLDSSSRPEVQRFDQLSINPPRIPCYSLIREET